MKSIIKFLKKQAKMIDYLFITFILLFIIFVVFETGRVELVTSSCNDNYGVQFCKVTLGYNFSYLFTFVFSYLTWKVFYKFWLNDD
jgi:hypothetical protein